MATNFPNIAIGQSSSKSTHNDLNTIKFGNGYEQRMPNGLNYRREMWTIEWAGLNQYDKDTIVSFIQAVSNGSTIIWTTPLDASPKKFVLEGDWSISDSGGQIYSIQLQLRQVYDLT